MNQENNYQEIVTREGDIRPGVFPSASWFKQMQKYVDFNNKSVLDIGCNIFSFGIQSIFAGAKSATGIEANRALVVKAQELISEFNITNANVMNIKAEDFKPDDLQTFDVAILSMVIHHLITPDVILKRIATYTEKMIIIYRYPNTFNESGWRPDFNELNQVMKSVGKASIVQKMISQTKEQNIGMAIYESSE